MFKSKKYYKEENNMSRFTGSEFKVSRRLSYSITETGKELKKRNFAPGQHGKD